LTHSAIRFIIVLLAGLAVHTATALEKITLFSSDIEVLSDRSLRVTETISVIAENAAIRRGIYRDFPTIYPIPGGWGHLGFRDKTGFDVDAILVDGKASLWHRETLDNGVRLYIGDPDHYVSVGAHRYEIRYTTTRQIASTDGRDILRWNVTGQGWTFPIDRAIATVHLPNGQSGSELKAWTGSSGSQEQAYTSSVNANGSVTFKTTRALQPFEGLTISINLPPDIIAPPQFRAWSVISNNFLLILGLLFLIALPIYYLRAWRAVGRDPEPGPIIADYHPVRGLSAAAHRFIINNQVDNETYTAALLGMAVKGWISIVQHSKKSFTVYKQSADKSPARSHTPLSPAEQHVYDILFHKSNAVDLGTTYDPVVSASKKKLVRFLTKEWRDAIYVNTRRYGWGGLVIGALALLFSGIHLNNFQMGLTLFAPILIFCVLGLLFSQPEARTIALIIFIGSSLLVVAKWLGPDTIEIPWQLWMGGLVLAMYLLFNYLLSAPTPFGRKVLDEIAGFKLYLETAEQDRLDILHPPERTPELFERLLPYAIALGVENRWSEQFAEVFSQQSAQNNSYQPQWYTGNYSRQLSAANLGGALSSGLSSSVASASTAPSSTSSGGGGGGGSGGGGGGGGGW